MSTDTLTKTTQDTSQPPQFRVLLLNDDYTPMDFVVFILRRYFRKTETEAIQVMQEAHEKGLATAGVYSFELAETKVSQVLRDSRREGHPLRCEIAPT